MSFVSLLSKHNGGLHFYEYVMLSAGDILEHSEAQAKASRVSKKEQRTNERRCVSTCWHRVVCRLAHEQTSNGSVLGAASTLYLASTYKKHQEWRNPYLPFAADIDGNMLVINTSTQTVHEWDEELGLGECVGESFADFLEVYRNELLGSKLEYIEVRTCTCADM